MKQTKTAEILIKIELSVIPSNSEEWSDEEIDLTKPVHSHGLGRPKSTRKKVECVNMIQSRCLSTQSWCALQLNQQDTVLVITTYYK